MTLDELRIYGEEHMNSGPDSYYIKILKLEYLHRETQAVVDSAQSLRRHTFWMAISVGLAAVTYAFTSLFNTFLH